MIEMLLMELATLCLYKDILRDKAVKKLILLLNQIKNQNGNVETLIEGYCAIYSILLEKKNATFYQYIDSLVNRDQNTFTLMCERKENVLREAVLKQAEKDLAILERMAFIRCDLIKNKIKDRLPQNSQLHRLVDELPDWNKIGKGKAWNHRIEGKIVWHERNGAGIFSEHTFFIWDGNRKKPVPVKNPDPITLDRLYHVESQKETAVKNTKMFLAGKTSNNVLFYGDRGTGKSSMVKAIANAFSHMGLRLIEIPKKFLYQLPMITSTLSERGLKFILFVDDLAFENNEDDYTELKAVLEGGIEYKPSNIVVYATSNRRHLVKEHFADRKGIFSDNPDEEIRARDSIQEKLSLADRFGVTVVFTSPMKKEYLNMILKMAEEEKICMEAVVLERKALQWEMAYNGMSPRTARQFINWLKAELEMDQET